MAQKRVDAGQRARKPGVVKSAKKESATNRAFYIVIIGIAVAGIGALTYVSTRPKETVAAGGVDTTLPPVVSSGYVMGNASAPVEVTEFGDFECPACGNFATVTEPDIRKHFVETGKIRWRFVDFPLPGHKNTWQASRAAACADEQQKFWPFHDALYQNQDRWNGEATSNPDKYMKELAGTLGLNSKQFNDCVDSHKYQAKIQAHQLLSMKRNVNQTPTFLVGDKQFAGGVPYDDFAKMINEALAKAPPGAPVAPASGDTAKSIPLGGKKKGE